MINANLALPPTLDQQIMVETISLVSGKMITNKEKENVDMPGNHSSAEFDYNNLHVHTIHMYILYINMYIISIMLILIFN